MERVLPIRIPPCETYQWIAFTMGMLMEHESVRDSIYNSYINLKCDRYGENQLNFIGGTAEDYRVEGIGEMDLFYLKNLAKENWRTSSKKESTRTTTYFFFTSTNTISPIRIISTKNITNTTPTYTVTMTKTFM